MRLAYVRWRDAVMETHDSSSDETKAASTELEEIGWLLDENEDAILIGMERPRTGMQQGRARLHIPRPNIKELRVVELAKAFPSKTTVWRS